MSGLRMSGLRQVGRSMVRWALCTIAHLLQALDPVETIMKGFSGKHSRTCIEAQFLSHMGSPSST